MCPNMRLFGIISKTATWAIEALDFTRRLPRGRMLTDKKITSFEGFISKSLLTEVAFVFLLTRPGRLAKFAVAGVRQTCHPL